MERITKSELLDMLEIPVARRASATSRIYQYIDGRSDGYGVGPQLKEGRDYVRVGRYIYYTKKGVERLRSLMVDYIPQRAEEAP